MLFNSPPQFVVLGALLVIGWLFGFASHPGSKKWKRKLSEQDDSHAAYRYDAEEQLAEGRRRIRTLEAENAALTARHAEAQATIDTLRTAPVPLPAPVAVAPAPEPAVERIEPAAKPADVVIEHVEPAAQRDLAAPVVPAALFPMTPTPTEAAPSPIGPAEPEMPSKGWFGSSKPDDLTRLRGIDSPMNTRLFGLGVTRFEDIEKLSAEDEMALELRLALPVGFIGREQWRQQAALLRSGNEAEHAERFGSSEAGVVA